MEIQLRGRRLETEVAGLLEPIPALCLQGVSDGGCAGLEHPQEDTGIRNHTVTATASSRNGNSGFPDLSFSKEPYNFM